MLYNRMFRRPGWSVGSLFDEMDRMRRLLQQTQPSFRIERSGVFPAVNLTETADHYFLRAELPGLKADDLGIEATGRRLSLTGERRILEQGQEAKYHRREREAGRFSRIIELPGEIDPDRIEARLRNGILTVRIPRSEAAKPRQIAVQ